MCFLVRFIASTMVSTRSVFLPLVRRSSLLLCA
jgi:hypothetical protein